MPKKVHVYPGKTGGFPVFEAERPRQRRGRVSGPDTVRRRR
ncbi:hypothetical protein BN903_95 [Halorubrum sp. AJ67]|nr:hypothetical protein BN903_95 [Halorubrum sp. AJ67]